jgi:predicted unusual protein kinase regulating ubiquinone biosynthesis (AarF/ABC1/UbiB family)
MPPYANFMLLLLLCRPCFCCLQVRHPGVSEAIERDFQTMVWLAHLAGQLLPATRALRLDDTLKQFAAPLHEQVRSAAAAAAAAAV